MVCNFSMNMFDYKEDTFFVDTWNIDFKLALTVSKYSPGPQRELRTSVSVLVSVQIVPHGDR